MLTAALECFKQGEPPVGPDQLEVGIHLDHGEAAAGRGDGVAFMRVRLLPYSQSVQLVLKGRSIHYLRQRGCGV